MAVSTRAFTPAATKHTHLVTFHTVETFSGSRQSAEDVTATNHDTNLYSHVVDFLDLLRIFAQTFFVNTVFLFSHQAFATEL